MVQVYVTQVEKLNREEYEALYDSVSAFRREKADRLRRPEDRLRSLAAGALFLYGANGFLAKQEAETWVGKEGAASWEEMLGSGEERLLHFGPMGKPFVQGMEFNLSHSGMYAAAAFGTLPLGIDVEGNRKPSERLVRHFHPEERNWYQMQGEEAFCRLWTAKESVMKRDGRGIAMGLDSFSVFSGELREEIYSVPLDEAYWLSLCTAQRWDGEIHRIAIRDLFRRP